MSYTIKSEYSNQELAGLYQEVILEHYKRPRFKWKGNKCSFCQMGKNPLCGDTLVVYCDLKKTETSYSLSAHFEGSGCSISQASASIMCAMVQDSSLERVREMISFAESTYTGTRSIDPDAFDQDIDALFGVSQFPVRIKCAALAWKTLECLITDNFDSSGRLLHPPCDKASFCSASQPEEKLKVVKTED